MNYIELIFNIRNISINQQDLLIARLYGLGFEAFEEKENTLSAFVLSDDFDLNLLKTQFTDTSFKILKINKVNQKNWNSIWESSFEPVIVSDDCRIRASFHKSHQKYKFDIIVNPKMSFGTGHHATTFLMMNKLLAMNLNKKIVLDVGCGTGVLSIMAEKKGALRINAIDIDEQAYLNSLENINLNSCQNISVSKVDVLNFNDNLFDVILANINKNVLLSEMEEYVKRLSKQGVLILSGFFDSDFDEINACVLGLQLKLHSKESKNKWQCLIYEK